MVLLEHRLNCFFACGLICFFQNPNSINAFLFDWPWTSSKNPGNLIGTDVPILSIPFEYKSEDEKFIEEASKYTDLMKSSSLDLCQHKVILQIKTSCHLMTEEELAKMSVNLLNCQSEVDGRTVFPCTEPMSLKECTKNMDANMWNAYHLMNNRARAVCLAFRRTQFHALTEIVVNKLMSTSRDQIEKMSNLLNGQEKLLSLTLGTLSAVEKGNGELLKQQETVQAAQEKIQKFVAVNLERLTAEKALIAAGNEELAKMTDAIKKKLDETHEQLILQSEERHHNHLDLLRDVETLQIQTRDVFQRIGSSTDELLLRQEKASRNYEAVVDNLARINETVHYLLRIINSTRRELDERFYWIQNFLDGTGVNIERILSITFHIIYLLVGMLFASFLNLSATSRTLLAIAVPANLYIVCREGPEKALNFFEITLYLTAAVIGTATVHRLRALYRSRENTPNSNNRFSLESHGENEKSEDASNDRTKNGNKNSSTETIGHVCRDVVYGLSRFLWFLPFAFARTEKPKSTGSSHRGPGDGSKISDNFFRKSVADDGKAPFGTWNDCTPLRDKYSQQSIHSRVNEWLQSKVDYTSGGSPSSTTSGSPKFYCSAVCRSGRRCKNTTMLGRDLCHRHSTENSVE